MAFPIREPTLHATPILALRPTQMTLGMVEVALKRQAWRAQSGKKLVDLLGRHMVPVILGPGQERFLIDHHHLARALHDEGIESVFVTVVADFHKLDEHDFWNMMDFHGWTHPFDNKGRRREYRDLPKTIKDMEDDPYRSLAGQLRAIGGFAKDTTPFSEFVWADFLRRRVKPKDVRKDFASALVTARDFAKSTDANYLPGWCAPHGSGLQTPKEKAPKGPKKSATPKLAEAD